MILASIARVKGEGWVLSPTGRRIITSDFLTSMRLRQAGSGAVLDLLDGENSVVDSVRVSG